MTKYSSIIIEFEMDEVAKIIKELKYNNKQ